MTPTREIVLVDRKSFHITYEGKNLDGLKISENGRGTRVSFALNKDGVKWLIEALSDFY